MKPIKLILAASVYTLLSGCVMMDSYQPVVEAIKYEKELLENSETISLHDAVRIASHARLNLVTQIGERNKQLNYLATAEILLTSALLADAAIDHSQDAAIIGALVGVSGLSIAQWVDDDRRPKLNALAASALSCAIEAVSPFQNVKDLSGDIKLLSNATAALVTAKSELAALKALIREPQQRAFIEKILILANSSQQNADITLKQAEVFQSKARNAGTQLGNAVRRIMDDLVSQSVEIEKSISQLQPVLQGLALQAASFTGQDNSLLFDLETPAIGSDGKAKNFENLTPSNLFVQAHADYAEKVGALAKALGDVVSLTISLEASINAIGKLQSKEQLAKCGIELKEAIPPLRVVPATPLKFDSKKGGKDGITIEGGNNQYFARLVGGQDGIKIIQEPFSKYVNINVESNKNIPERDYRLEVSDTTGASTTAIIRITSENSATDQRGGTEEAQSKRGTTDFCVANPTDGICDLQTGLEAFGFLTPNGVDGACENKTQKAMQEFKALAFPEAQHIVAECSNTVEFTQKVNEIMGQMAVTAVNMLGLNVRHLELMFQVVISTINPNGVLTVAEQKAIDASPLANTENFPQLDYAKLESVEGVQELLEQVKNFVDNQSVRSERE